MFFTHFINDTQPIRTLRTIHHMHESISIALMLNVFLDEPDVKIRTEFLIFSIMFIFHAQELE